MLGWPDFVNCSKLANPTKLHHPVRHSIGARDSEGIPWVCGAVKHLGRNWSIIARCAAVLEFRSVQQQLSDDATNFSISLLQELCVTFSKVFASHFCRVRSDVHGRWARGWCAIVPEPWSSRGATPRSLSVPRGCCGFPCAPAALPGLAGTVSSRTSRPRSQRRAEARRGSRPRHSVRACGEPLLLSPSGAASLMKMKRGRYRYSYNSR